MSEQKIEAKPLSRSEREAQIKDKAGWVITVIACLLAATTYISNNFSSKAMTNLIKANDTYSFYQAKSIKQSIAEGQLEDAKDPKRREQLEAKIARYESDPKSGEGKRELLARARALEAERDEAKKRSPWIGYASTMYQLSIVVLSASILAVSMGMFWGSFFVAGLGILLSAQGLFLWF